MDEGKSISVAVRKRAVAASDRSFKQPPYSQSPPKSLPSLSAARPASLSLSARTGVNESYMETDEF